MAPLSTLCEWFDINMAKEGGTVILKRGDSTAHINVGEAVIGMDGAYYNLSAAPYIKNGEVMVPARNIVELYGGSIEWYPLSNIAAIERPPADCSLPEGYAVMKSVTPDSGSVDGGNVAENAIDFDIDTIWAAKGIGRYIDIELEKRQEIDRVEILFNPNSGRNAEFEVFVSDDGVNYRSILESTSNGALEEVAWEIYPLSEPVMAKYVRYMGNGSNISQWNAIKEIRFRLWDDGDDDPSPLENIQVLYSATGSDYANIPDMKDTKTEYTVILPDNSKYAYLRFAVPAGQTAPNTVRYSWNVDCARDWFGENGEDLLGTAEGSGTIDTHVKYQTYVPMEVVAENGIYKVPIKNEFSTVYFSYTDENGTGRDYELNFHAKQPRLTSFTNVLSDRYNSMDEARVVFVSGAAVNNDNGTIVHSGIKESDKIKVMANISEELIGASMFMLPIRSGGASSLFTFTADHGGKIYVLSDEQISGSGYSGWTRENNGTLPTGMQTGTSITVPRDYNSFEGIYALSINWKADRRSSDYGSGTKNYYRAVSPAVSGNLTSTHLTGSYGMKYAYSRTFNAGETVTVPGLGNTSPDSAVIIKWTGDEITEDVSYSVNKKGKITVKASGFTEGNKLISAFYDEAGRLTDCDLMDYSDGVTELEMNPNLYAIANRMKMFIWNTETLEGYFMKEQSMSGIIQ